MISAIIIRGGGAFVSFASMSLIIALLGLELSGEYFTFVAYSMILATVISFGMNGIVVKYSQDEVFSDILKFKIFTFDFLQTALVVLFLFGLISLLFHIDFVVFLMGFCFSFAQMIHVFLIAKGHVNFSYFMFNIFPLFFITLFVWLNHNFIYFYYSLFYAAAAFIMFLYLRIKLNKTSQNSSTDKKWGISERLDFFQQEILGQSFTSISVVLVSFNLSSANVAIFNFYQKLASVCNIVLSVLNQTRLSVCLGHLSNGMFVEIQKESKKIFINSSIILSLYVVFVFIFWNIITDYIIDSRSINFSPFLILAMSYFLVGYSNISTYILNSHENAKYVRNVSYLSFFIGLLLFTLLPIFYGVLGGVIASSIILINQALLTKFKFLKVTNVRRN